MSGQRFDNNGGNVQVQGTVEHATFYMNVGAHDHDRQTSNRCLDYLASTDPRNIKTDIYQTRGVALKESYQWILRHPQFQRWCDDEDSQVLWIKGDPGKGKTMLLCGIIDELRLITKLEDPESTTLLSFFFCQATVPKLSNAHAVLRGLIYMLVKQQPLFLSYVQERFRDTGEPRFGDTEAWAALSNMLLDILRDPDRDKIYIVVDALDECVQDQDKLLHFILREAKELSHVKWIISSRNHVEQRTRLENSQAILSLELQENAESVSVAIGAYISKRTAELESLQNDDTLLEYVQQTLQRKAEGTFLWVALVAQELQDIDSSNMRQVVDDIPKGLDDFYMRMIDQMKRLASIDMEYCRLILSAATLAYRPLLLLELGVVSGLPDTISGNTRSLEKLVKKCGFFNTLRDKTISFVHHSAKEYLIKKGGRSIFPSGFAADHRRIFTQSLQAMQKTLRRNIYGLHAIGTSIDQAQPPEPDPLAAVGYSCVYWVDHLEQYESHEELEDTGPVNTLLRTRYLFWLEALSLLRSITDGILSIQKLRRLLLERSAALGLRSLVQDAYRFILYHRTAIENSPLQTYGSALVFSPSQSIINELFCQEKPNNIAIAPSMGTDWDAHTGACLQTLEGHNDSVNSVMFSHDSSRVVSGSNDKTIKIWDAHTGACLQTLGGHSNSVNSVVFSYDSSRIASGSKDKRIKIWDVQDGVCLWTLDSHNDWIRSVALSPNSSYVASGSDDKTVKIWDLKSGVCRQTLEGHDERVNSVVFSPDSSLVASGSDDKKIKIWDLKSGVCRQTLEGHDERVNSVVFSPDSSRLASGSGDKTIKIWDAQSNACLQTLQGHNRAVNSVMFSHDSSHAVSVSNDWTIKIWNTQSGVCLQTLNGHTRAVNSTAFSPNSSRLASGSNDTIIKIWDAQRGTCLQTLEGHNRAVNSVVFSPDSSCLASASNDKTIKIWDAKRGTCLRTLVGHNYRVRSVVFSNDSRRIASGSGDHTIKIWDAQTGACLQTLEGHKDWIRSVTFSPDSSRLASGSNDTIIKIWDAQRGTCVHTLEGHTRTVNSVVFSPDSSCVASASNDKTIKIWDAKRGTCLRTLVGHNYRVRSVVFSNDSRRIASGSGDHTIKIWDAQTGACLQTLEGHKDWVRSVTFSPDSSRLVSGSNDRAIKIWNAQTGSRHTRAVHSVSFSPDSSRLASGSGDHTIKIWDAQTGACLQTLEGHNSWVSSVMFSPDNSHVVSKSNDNTIKIWSTNTGACLQTLKGPHMAGKSVMFSPDSRRVASGSYDKTIKIWNAQTGACLQTLEGHISWVSSVVFSPDSSCVASGSYDKTIKIWDVQSGACLQTLDGHNDRVVSVVFSYDGSYVASGSEDKTIKIWVAQTGACLRTLDGHEDSVRSVVFSPDSRRLASGSRDKTIKIWDAHTGACLQTLDVGSAVSKISFDNTSSSLLTNVGIIAMPHSPTPATKILRHGLILDLRPDPGIEPSRDPEYLGYGISSDRFWITRHSQNWLWLPPMYRPSCSSVAGSGLALVLGCQSGRVLIFGFAAEDSN